MAIRKAKPDDMLPVAGEGGAPSKRGAKKGAAPKRGAAKKGDAPVGRDAPGAPPSATPDDTPGAPPTMQPPVLRTTPFHGRGLVTAPSDGALPMDAAAPDAPVPLHDSGTLPMRDSGTLPMPSGGTLPMDAQSGHRLYITEPIVIQGEKDSYRITPGDANLLGHGGESLVYRAERLSNGEAVVAKVYDQFSKDPLMSFNRKEVISFLKKHDNFKKTNIMPLLDSGVVDLVDSYGELHKEIFVDIIPECKDGDISKNQARFTYATLRTKIIPGILQALNMLHTAKLVHRDLKPSNLYFHEGVLVIADFGTTSRIFDNDEHSVILTINRRGTTGYMAPEAEGGYPSFASDYYALGCTIATLYKGSHVYQNLLDGTKLERITVSSVMNRKGLPLECPEKDAPLQKLVNALTTYDFKKRAGFDYVLAWIKDPDSTPNIVQLESETVINFDGVQCNTAGMLITQMVKKWDIAKKYLYKDTFKRYFEKNNPTLSQQADDIVNDEITAVKHDFGLAKYIQLISKSGNMEACPYYWCGVEYDKLYDISVALSAGNEHEISDITEMLRCGFLSWKIENTQAEPNASTLKALKEIEDMAADYPHLGRYAFMYTFAHTETETGMMPDQLFRSMTGSAGEWYKKARELMLNDMELGQLYAAGYRKSDIYLLKKATGALVSENGDSDLTYLYLFFESVCDNKQVVRDHFMEYGPGSYLFWWRKNIGMYKFNNPTSVEIHDKIKNTAVSNTMTITDLIIVSNALKQLLFDFQRQFQENYLLSIFGIQEKSETKGITTNNTFGYFVENFYNIRVPVGFHRHIYG